MSISKFVNHVFVGKGVAPADLNTLNIGDVTIVDEKGAVPSATSDYIKVVKVVAKNALSLPDGTVVPNASVVHSSDILKREELFTPEVYVIPAKPAIEQEVSIDLSSASIQTGYNRAVLRILFKDTEGTKTQITKSFDYVSPLDYIADVVDMLSVIAKKINKYAGSVVAIANGTELTITAIPNSNDSTCDYYSTYNKVEFQASMFVTKTEGIAEEISIPGIVIETTKPSFRGNGTAAQVRDAERSGLPYLGNVNFIGEPGGKPEMTVNMSKTYDTVVIEYNKKYRSTQEQYVESTPRSIEIYAEAGTGAVLGSVLTTFYA